MKAKKGFTLIELLAVIAIIALLIGIILPALKAAKIQAQIVICMTNLNGLSKAWIAFPNDNNGNLVNGNVPVYTSGYNILNHQNPPPYWVSPPQDENYIYTGSPTQSPGPPTLEQKKLGIIRGDLFPYIGNVESYRCPGDLGRTMVPNSQNPHPENVNYRSYCISDMMNGWNPTKDRRVAAKITHILNPGNKFVFVETFDPRGWLMGGWRFVPESAPPQSDTLTMWHKKRSGFGFADGHAEMHTWTDPDIIRSAENPNVDWFSYTNVNSDDYKFLVRGYIPVQSSAKP